VRGEHLLGARLRPANIDPSASSLEEIERIVQQIRQAWPSTRIILRAYSGFCHLPACIVGSELPGALHIKTATVVPPFTVVRIPSIKTVHSSGTCMTPARQIRGNWNGTFGTRQKLRE
jgi:hypothetical protein